MCACAYAVCWGDETEMGLYKEGLVHTSKVAMMAPLDVPAIKSIDSSRRGCTQRSRASS